HGSRDVRRTWEATKRTYVIRTHYPFPGCSTVTRFVCMVAHPVCMLDDPCIASESPPCKNACPIPAMVPFFPQVTKSKFQQYHTDKEEYSPVPVFFFPGFSLDYSHHWGGHQKRGHTADAFFSPL